MYQNRKSSNIKIKKKGSNNNNKINSNKSNNNKNNSINKINKIDNNNNKPSSNRDAVRMLTTVSKPTMRTVASSSWASSTNSGRMEDLVDSIPKPRATASS